MALQERVLTKTANLVGALAAALVRRGVDDGLAKLTAQIGMAVLGYAATAWFDNPKPGLEAHLRRAFETLQHLAPTICKPDPHVG